jgi:hypothetical protein
MDAVRDGIDQREDVRRLFVTGPERDRLYEHFQRLFFFYGDVEVVKDRRCGERRHARVSPARERRSTDRRIAGPEWVVPPE